MAPARTLLLILAASALLAAPARADGVWTLETVSSGTFGVSLTLDNTGATYGDPAVSRAGLYFLRARFGAGESAVARFAILR